MASRGHQRQVLLFLVAVLLPSVVLIALGARLISQERELGEKRLVDEQRQLVGQVRKELLTRLERIKLEEASLLAAQGGETASRGHGNPEVALVTTIEGDRLILPWEADPAVKRAQQQLGEVSFASAIRQGEQEELVESRFSRAAERYRGAMRAARHPAQIAYARLLLARTLTKSGRQREALSHYRAILAEPSDVVDEHGVPFALYAAAQLLEAAESRAEVSQRIRQELERDHWLSPPTTYLLRALTTALAESATAVEFRERIEERVRRLEQSLALQRDIAGLMLVHASQDVSTDDPRWVLYGSEPWLVGLTSAIRVLPRLVIAVRFEDVFAQIVASPAFVESAAGRPRLFSEPSDEGVPLGGSFPGLALGFDPIGTDGFLEGWNLQRSFYLISLFLVLGVTLFGAYLLWRDVRRELRLAEMRAQFVSSVSHELKTPLTAIRMFAETLQMERSQDPKMRGEYLETIVNESERLTRLLNNVLDLSKIEQNQKRYRLELTSLAEVVRKSAGAMRYPLAQQGFSLDVETDDALPPVKVDADAIEQAVLNLLTNAMKYSGQSRALDLRLHQQNGQAVIAVTDRGVGIRREEQPRLVEKFYRSPTPENQRIPGTGLGLTLVEHIVKAHGGYLEVDSAVGEGSTFSIYLPLERGA